MKHLLKGVLAFAILVTGHVIWGQSFSKELYAKNLSFDEVTLNDPQSYGTVGETFEGWTVRRGTMFVTPGDTQVNNYIQLEAGTAVISQSTGWVISEGDALTLEVTGSNELKSGIGLALMYKDVNNNFIEISSVELTINDANYATYSERIVIPTPSDGPVGAELYVELRSPAAIQNVRSAGDDSAFIGGVRLFVEPSGITKTDSAIVFNGNGNAEAQGVVFDGVNYQKTAFLPAKSSQATYSLWFKPSEQTATSPVLFSLFDPDVNTELYSLTLAQDLSSATFGKTGQTVTVEHNFTTDKWHHITAFVDNQRIYLIVNGIHQSARFESFDLATNLSPVFYLGANSLKQQAYVGSIDDLKVYDSLLTGNEIITNLNERPTSDVNYPNLAVYYSFDEPGYPVFSDFEEYQGDANNIDNQNNALYFAQTDSPAPSAVFGDSFATSNSLLFTDDTTVLTVNDGLSLQLLNDWSVEVWVNRQGDTTYMPLTNRSGIDDAGNTLKTLDADNNPTDADAVDANGNPTRGLSLRLTQVDNGQVGVSNENDASVTYALPQNEWHHVVWVRQGANVTVYVDGVAQADVLTEGGALKFNKMSLEDPNAHIFAKLDEFRVWSKALTPTEVSDSYNLSPDFVDNLINGNFRDLLIYYNFDIPNETVLDRSNSSIFYHATVSGVTEQNFDSTLQFSKPNVYFDNLAIDTNGSCSFDVRWDPIAGADKYVVEVTNVDTNTPLPPVEVVGQNIATFTNLDPATEYSVSVYASADVDGNAINSVTTTLSVITPVDTDYLAIANQSNFNLSPAVGTDVVITLQVLDQTGSVKTDFDGAKDVTISGLLDKTHPFENEEYQPTLTYPIDANGGETTRNNASGQFTLDNVYFNQGVATLTFLLRNIADQTLVIRVDSLVTDLENAGVDAGIAEARATVSPGTFTPLAGSDAEVRTLVAGLNLINNGNYPYGLDFTPAPSFLVFDQFGNPISTPGREVALAPIEDGAYFLTGDLSIQPDENGIATFADLGVINLNPFNYTLAVGGNVLQVSFDGAFVGNQTSAIEVIKGGKGNPGSAYVNTAEGAAYFNSDSVFEGPEALTTEMSLATWFKPDKVSGRQMIFTTGNGALKILVNDNRIRAEINGTTGGEFKYNFDDFRFTEGEWYWLNISFDNGVFSIYVNETLVKTLNVNTVGFTELAPAESLTVGAAANSNDKFIGTLDELSIWNRALSASEFSSFAFNGLNGTESGLVAYYKFDYLLDFSGEQKIIDTTQYRNDLVLNGNTTLQDSTAMGAPFITSISDIQADFFTVNWGLRDSFKSPQKYLIEWSKDQNFDPAGASYSSFEQIDPAVRRHSILLNERGQVYFTRVTAIYSSTATVQSLPVRVATLSGIQPPGNALTLREGPDELQRVQVQTGTVTTPAFTFETWINVDPTELDSQWLSFNQGLLNMVIVNGDLDAGIASLQVELLNNPAFTSAQNIRFNEWTHVAVTVDAINASLVLYLNGQAVNTQDLNPVDNFALNGYWLFGLLGEIDETRLWQKALTSTEIQNGAFNIAPFDANVLSALSYDDTQLVDAGTANERYTLVDLGSQGIEAALSGYELNGDKPLVSSTVWDRPLAYTTKDLTSSSATFCFGMKEGSACQVSYALTPDFADAQTVNVTAATGGFTEVDIVNLEADQLYYVRVVANNNTSNTVSFRTSITYPGNALHFDGTTSVSATYEGVTTDAFTFGTWVLPTALANAESPMVHLTADNNINYSINLLTDNQVNVKVGANNFDLPIELPINQWNYIFVAIDANAINVYVDGQTFTFASDFTETVLSGALFAATEPTETTFYTGALDSVRLWRQSVSSDTIESFIFGEDGLKEDALLITALEFDINTAFETEVRGNGQAVFNGTPLSITSFAGIQVPQVTFNSFTTVDIDATWETPTFGTVDNYTIEVSDTADFSSIPVLSEDTTEAAFNGAIATEFKPYFARVYSTQNNAELGFAVRSIASTTTSLFPEGFAANRAVTLNGQDTSFSFNTPTLNGQSSINLSVWFELDADSNTALPIITSNDGTNDLFGLFVSSEGISLTGTENDFAFNLAISSSIWHQVSVNLTLNDQETFDGELYFDGQFIGLMPSVAPSLDFAQWVVGKDIANNYFTGSLDELVVYANTLNATQIESGFYTLDPVTTATHQFSFNQLSGDYVLDTVTGTPYQVAGVATYSDSGIASAVEGLTLAIINPTATTEDIKLDWLNSTLNTVESVRVDYGVDPLFSPASNPTSVSLTAGEATYTIVGLDKSEPVFVRVVSLTNTNEGSTSSVLSAADSSTAPGLAIAGSANSSELTPLTPVQSGDDWSLEFWVKPNKTNSLIAEGVANTDINKGATSWKLFTGSMQFTTPDGVKNSIVANPRIGSWSHLAFTRSGSLITTYLNGALVDSINVEGDLSFTLNKLTVVNSTIDEFRVWNRTLNAAEVSQFAFNEPTTTADLVCYYQFDQLSDYGFVDQSQARDHALFVNGTINFTVEESRAFGTPLITKFTNLQTDAFTVAWSAGVGSLDAYRVDVATTEDALTSGNNLVSSELVPATTTTSTIPGLTSGQVYFVRVGSVQGNLTRFSPVTATSTLVGPMPGNALSFEEVTLVPEANVYLPLKRSLSNIAGFTIEFWAKRQASNNTLRSVDGQQTIFDSGNFTVFNKNETDLGVTLIGENFASYSYTDATLVDVWNHYAFVHSPGATAADNQFLFYLNGVLQTPAGLAPPTTLGVATDVYLGADKSGRRTEFNGQMDELRIWTTERSEAQIKQFLATTIDPYSAGLKHYYRFDSGINITESEATLGYDPATQPATLVDLTGTAHGELSGGVEPTPQWVRSAAFIQEDGADLVIPNVGVSSFTGVTASNFVVNWEGHALADSYNVRISDNENPEDVNANNQVITGIPGVDPNASSFGLSADMVAENITVVANSIYYVQIQAVVGGTAGQWGTIDFVQTLSTTLPDSAYSFNGIVNSPVLANNSFSFNGATSATFSMWAVPVSQYHTDANNTPDKTTLFEFFNGTGEEKISLSIQDNELDLIYKTDAFGDVLLKYQAASKAEFRNRWHLYTVVIDGELGEVAIYVDDIKVASQSVPGIGVTEFNKLTVGDAAGGGSPFKGLIDEFAVISRSSKAGEVSANMTTRVLTTDTDLLALYRFDAIKGTSSILDAGPNKFHLESPETLVVADSYAFLSPQSLAATNITETGFDANWLPGEFANITAEPFVTNYSQHILDEDFVSFAIDVAKDALYTDYLNGSVLNDVGLANSDPQPGLNAGSSYFYRVVSRYQLEGPNYYTAGSRSVPVQTLFAGGAPGNAIELNGANYVQVKKEAGNDAGAALNFGTDSFTVQAWVNTTTDNGTILSNWDNITETGYELAINNGSLQFILGDGTSTITADLTTGANTGSWVQVTVVVDRLNELITAYFNGRSILDRAINTGFDSVTNTSGLYIGNNEQNAFFNGQIDEVRIWNVAKSSAEIDEEYYNYVGSSNSLVLNYRFDVTAGNDISDFSGKGYSGVVLAGQNAQWISSYAMGAPQISDARNVTDTSFQVNFGGITGKQESAVVYKVFVSDSFDAILNATAGDFVDVVTNGMVFEVDPDFTESPIQFYRLMAEYESFAGQDPLEQRFSDFKIVSRLDGAVAPGTTITFDGTKTVKFNASNRLETTPITVETWIQPINRAGGILAIGNATAVALGIAVEDNGLRFTYAGDAYSLAYPWEPGDWFHLAVVGSATGSKIYINGALLFDSPVPFTPVADSGLIIGNNVFAGGTPFDGGIDGVRIWNSVRSQTEIANNLYVAADLNDPELLVRVGLDEGAGTNVFDSAGSLNVGAVYEGNNPVNNADFVGWKRSSAYGAPNIKGAARLAIDKDNFDLERTYKGLNINFSKPAGFDDQIAYQANFYTSINATNPDLVSNTVFSTDSNVTIGLDNLGYDYTTYYDVTATFVTNGQTVTRVSDRRAHTTGALAPGRQLNLRDEAGLKMTISSRTPIVTAGEEYTVEFWLKGTSALANSQRIEFRQGTAEYFTIRNDGTNLEFTKSAGSTNDADRIIVPNVDLGIAEDPTWHHVAVVFAGARLTVYIDGVVIDAKVLPNFPARNLDSITFRNAFNGLVDEFRVWSRAKSQIEVRRTMAATVVDVENATNLVTYLQFDEFYSPEQAGTPSKFNLQDRSQRNVNVLVEDITAKQIDLNALTDLDVAGLQISDLTALEVFQGFGGDYIEGNGLSFGGITVGGTGFAVIGKDSISPANWRDLGGLPEDLFREVYTNTPGGNIPAQRTLAMWSIHSFGTGQTSVPVDRAIFSFTDNYQSVNGQPETFDEWVKSVGGFEDEDLNYGLAYYSPETYRRARERVLRGAESSVIPDNVYLEGIFVNGEPRLPQQIITDVSTFFQPDGLRGTGPQYGVVFDFGDFDRLEDGYYALIGGTNYVLTPVYGMDSQLVENNGQYRVEWSVEKEIGTAYYLVEEFVNGQWVLVEKVMAGNGYYAVNVDGLGEYRIVSVDDNGFRQSFAVEIGFAKNQYLELNAGWNLISISSANADLSAIEAIADGPLWQWDGKQYVRVEGSVAPYTGLWVFRDTTASTRTVRVSGDYPATGLVELPNRWNLVGPPRNMLAPKAIEHIYGWTPEQQYSIYDQILQDHDGLIEGHGYWFYSDEPQTLDMAE